MFLLGYDVGSSSIKASLIHSATGECAGSSSSPKHEMPIMTAHPDWAEQEPEVWWKHIKTATHDVLKKTGVNKEDIQAIGIGYQMHGLVIVDKNQSVLRPAIIWCDSRSVAIGETAFRDLGQEQCLSSYLNSPGNFTASKLKWVQTHEHDIYQNIYKIMLPGDYIAMKLSGEITTTVSGLSEAILWDYKSNTIAYSLLDYYGINHDMVPSIVPTFAHQCSVNKRAAAELGLKEGTPITYRAGDQPNNALSLNVLNPGEIAATAGTSGVIYGVTDKPLYDRERRVNTFVHVNDSLTHHSYGILMCLNGAGCAYRWLKQNYFNRLTYDQMNKIASGVSVGAQGLTFLPYGNGAERTLGNVDIDASLHGLHFNIHAKEHIVRAVIEGIAYGMSYGLEYMKKLGIPIQSIKAGFSNMFLCPVFSQTLSTVTGVPVELYNTDGSTGAARGAGIGGGVYDGYASAFKNLKTVGTVNPQNEYVQQTGESYARWKDIVEHELAQKAR
jgi:xylulokinase